MVGTGNISVCLQEQGDNLLLGERMSFRYVHLQVWGTETKKFEVGMNIMQQNRKG